MDLLDFTSTSVASAGDFNGDGYDVIIGVPGMTLGGVRGRRRLYRALRDVPPAGAADDLLVVADGRSLRAGGGGDDRLVVTDNTAVLDLRGAASSRVNGIEHVDSRSDGGQSLLRDAHAAFDLGTRRRPATGTMPSPLPC